MLLTVATRTEHYNEEVLSGRITEVVMVFMPVFSRRMDVAALLARKGVWFWKFSGPDEYVDPSFGLPSVPLSLRKRRRAVALSLVGRDRLVMLRIFDLSARKALTIKTIRPRYVLSKQ